MDRWRRLRCTEARGGKEESSRFHGCQDERHGWVLNNERGKWIVLMNPTYIESLAWIDSPTNLDDTVQRLRDIRALGLDVGLDFHGRLHKGMARQLAKLLEPHQPLFIEGMLHWTMSYCLYINYRPTEPLLPSHPQETADLAKLVSTPIALGERLFSRSDFRPYFEARAIDIAQPDVSAGCRRPLYLQSQLTASFNRYHTVAVSAKCTASLPLQRLTMSGWLLTVLSVPLR